MALAFDAEPTFTPGAVTELFEMAPYYTLLPARRIAVAPDGQRFLLLKIGGGLSGAEAGAPTHRGELVRGTAAAGADGVTFTRRTATGAVPS